MVPEQEDGLVSDWVVIGFALGLGVLNLGIGLYISFSDGFSLLASIAYWASGFCLGAGLKVAIDVFRG